MKWIEVIKVRASKERALILQSWLQKQLQKPDAIPGLEQTIIAEHSTYEGDLALVLFWDSDGPPDKSRLGLLLGDNLENFGLVDHAIWISSFEISNGKYLIMDDIGLDTEN